MDAFLNTNNSKNKDLREFNPRKNDEQDVVINYSGIGFSQIFISKVICILNRVHLDVVGMLVTSESSCSINDVNTVILA